MLVVPAGGGGGDVGARTDEQLHGGDHRPLRKRYATPTRRRMPTGCRSTMPSRPSLISINWPATPTNTVVSVAARRFVVQTSRRWCAGMDGHGGGRGGRFYGRESRLVRLVLTASDSHGLQDRRGRLVRRLYMCLDFPTNGVGPIGAGNCPGAAGTPISHQQGCRGIS